MISSKRVGWVGLGAIGLGMAQSAARAGHKVTGHTRGKTEHESLLQAGGQLACELQKVVQDKDVVCINVFNAEQIHDVLYTQGVLEMLSPETVLILHTTSAPVLIRQVASELPPVVKVIDGAFSGSPAQALEGTLTVMAGGDEDAFELAEPILATYASYLRHVGPLGSGMRIKLINNLLFASQIALASDVFRLAEETDIDAKVIADVIGRSSGASTALTLLSRHERPAVGSEGMRSYLEKDVQSALQAAESEGLDLGRLAQLLAPQHISAVSSQ